MDVDKIPHQRLIGPNADVTVYNKETFASTHRILCSTYSSVDQQLMGWDVGKFKKDFGTA
jgi:hypothetical protein